MKIKLLETCHIPDEVWTKTEEHPEQPIATNYAGAVLEISKENALPLIRDRKAVALDASGAQIEVDEEGEPVAAATTDLEQRVAHTFGGGESQ